MEGAKPPLSMYTRRVMNASKIKDFLDENSSRGQVGGRNLDLKLKFESKINEIKHISKQINKSYSNDIAKIVELSYQVSLKDAFEEGIVIGKNYKNEEIKVYRTKSGKFSFKKPEDKDLIINNKNNNQKNQEYNINELTTEIETMLNVSIEIEDNLLDNLYKNKEKIDINEANINNQHQKLIPVSNLTEQLSHQINLHLDKSINRHKKNIKKIKGNLENVKDDNIVNIEEDKKNNKEENFNEIKDKFKKLIEKIDIQKIKDISLAISYIEKMESLSNNENKIKNKIIIIHCLEKIYKKITRVIVKKEIKYEGARYEKAFTLLSVIVRKYNNYLMANRGKKDLKNINQWISDNLRGDGELEQFRSSLQIVIDFELRGKDENIKKEFEGIYEDNLTSILSRIPKLKINDIESQDNSYDTINNKNINSKIDFNRSNNFNKSEKKIINVKSKIYVEKGKKRKNTNLDFTSKNYLSNDFFLNYQKKSKNEFSPNKKNSKINENNNNINNDNKLKINYNKNINLDENKVKKNNFFINDKNNLNNNNNVQFNNINSNIFENINKNDIKNYFQSNIFSKKNKYSSNEEIPHDAYYYYYKNRYKSDYVKINYLNEKDNPFGL